MARTIKRKVTLYWVDCYTNGGMCYSSHYDCTWQDVLTFKKTAKMLGETIKYEKFGSKEYTYTI